METWLDRYIDESPSVLESVCSFHLMYCFNTDYSSYLNPSYLLGQNT